MRFPRKEGVVPTVALRNKLKPDRSVISSQVVTTKSILVFCPKGGVGKTTLARSLAVAASLDKQRVLVIDFDADQGTFTKWYNKRQMSPLSQSSFDCERGDFHRWREIWNDAQNYDLVIIDSPPGIEGKEHVIHDMSAAVDMILIPTNVSDDDTDIAMEWMSRFRDRRLRNVKFVMSKIVSPKRTTLNDALLKLRTVGPVLGTHLPLREDILNCNDLGLSPIELPKLKSRTDLSLLWAELKHEIEI